MILCNILTQVNTHSKTQCTGYEFAPICSRQIYDISRRCDTANLCGCQTSQYYMIDLLRYARRFVFRFFFRSTYLALYRNPTHRFYPWFTDTPAVCPAEPSSKPCAEFGRRHTSAGSAAGTYVSVDLRANAARDTDSYEQYHRHGGMYKRVIPIQQPALIWIYMAGPRTRAEGRGPRSAAGNAPHL